MKYISRILLATITLAFLWALLTQFPRGWSSVAAEENPYPPPDSIDNLPLENPYPSPALPSQPSPYPPPEYEENPPQPGYDNDVMLSDELIADAEAYATTHDVETDEALERLKLQGAIENLNAQLLRKESETFAGLWIQHTPDFRVIFRFTKNGVSTLEPYIQGTPLSKIAEVRSANASLEKLRLEQAYIAQVMEPSGIPFRTGINVKENKVELHVLNSTEVESYLSDMNILMPKNMQIIKDNNLGSEVDEIYGGLALSTCTSGFSVIDNQGTAGVTTAGHCRNDQYFNGVELDFKGGTLPGQDYDIQWHGADHAFDVVGRIEDGLGGRAILSEKFRDSQVIGGYVCKYGMETGRECGYIAEIYVNGINVRVNIPVIEGDSGGPWFLLNTAYGTTIYRCELGDGTPCAIYGPVDQIHEILGLTLAYRVYLPLVIKD